MVQPCCDNTYAKYQTEPHVVQPERFKKLFGVDAETETVEEKGTEWATFIFSQHGRYPRETFVIRGSQRARLCTCECHVIGTNVCH